MVDEFPTQSLESRKEEEAGTGTSLTCFFSLTATLTLIISLSLFFKFQNPPILTSQWRRVKAGRVLTAGVGSG